MKLVLKPKDIFNTFFYGKHSAKYFVELSRPSSYRNSTVFPKIHKTNLNVEKIKNIMKIL